MKKIFFVMSCTSLLLLGCKKEAGNKSIIKEENSETTVTNNNGVVDSSSSSSTVIKDGEHEIQQHTYRYVAEDGSNAHVTFTNTDKGNQISIRSNNKTIAAPQIEASAKGGIYKTHDVEIVASGDSVTITQGNNVIELKKAKGQ